MKNHPALPVYWSKNPTNLKLMWEMFGFINFGAPCGDISDSVWLKIWSCYLSVVGCVTLCGSVQWKMWKKLVSAAITWLFLTPTMWRWLSALTKMIFFSIFMLKSFVQFATLSRKLMVLFCRAHLRAHQRTLLLISLSFNTSWRSFTGALILTFTHSLCTVNYVSFVRYVVVFKIYIFFSVSP